MKKGLIVALVILVAIVAGLLVASRNGIPKPPQLPEGSTRVLFTGHMYALTNHGKGRRSREFMAEEGATSIVTGGDSISGDAEEHLDGREFDLALLRHQWKKFDDYFAGFQGEVVVLPGNHDLLTSKGDPIQSGMRTNVAERNPFEKLYGRRTIGQCATYYLNTVDLTSTTPSYQLDPEQLSWVLSKLEEDSSSGIPCVVLFMHHRLWEMGSYTSVYKGDAEQFKQIERRLKKFSTAFVCAGDLGIIEEFEKDGITYFNVSNMVGHNGYVRLDFGEANVRAQLIRLGSPFWRQLYYRLH